MPPMSPRSLSKKRNLPQARVSTTQSSGTFSTKFGVVVAPGLGAVAAGDEEEVPDLLALHRVDDRAGHAHDGIAGKAHHDRLAVPVLGEAGQLEGPLDHGGEVAAGDVGHAGPAHETGREDVLLVGRLGALDAVGGHENCAGELGELLGLVLPGRAVVAGEVAVFLESRVAVGGEHLAVGVDVDSLALGLLEQRLEVLQVVAGDQDGLALLCAEGHGGGHGVAVGARVGRIEKLHRAQVHLAALQHQSQGRLERDRPVGKRGQRLMDERIDGRVFLAQDLGVVGVGRDALDAEEQRVLQGENVGVCRRVGLESRRFPLGDKPLEGSCRLERERVDAREAPARCLDFPGEHVAVFDCLPDQGHESRRVEVHVRQRREERLHREDVRLAIDDALPPRLVRRGRQPDEGVDQEVLQGGHVVRLAADAPLRAGLAFYRLLALVTEHGQTPPFNGCMGACFRDKYDRFRGNSLIRVKKTKKRRKRKKPF